MINKLNFFLNKFLFSNFSKINEIDFDKNKKTIEYPPYLSVGCFKNQIRKIIIINVKNKYTSFFSYIFIF